MEVGSARLTDEIPAQRAVAAIISRQEVASALDDGEARPELVLDIAQRGENGSEERSTISMTWSRDDLEKLLEQATSDRVILTFDRDELSQAVIDVEAHGMRGHAAVFAVAIAGALGTGAIATAMPTSDPGDPVAVAAPTSVTDVSSTGGYTAPAAVASEAGPAVTDASSGSGYAATSEGGPVATDASSGGGYTAPAAAASEAGPAVTDASSGGGYAAPTVAASASDSRVTDVSSGGGYPPAVDSGSSGGLVDFHAPSPIDGAIAGGIALAIAGAAFASRRSGTARPA